MIFLRCCGRRIDHFFDLSDLRRRKATNLTVLADDGLVLGEIDTEGFVVSNVAFDPLNIKAKLVQCLIRLGGSSPKLLALKGADFRNVSFDNKPAQCRSFLPSTASARAPNIKLRRV
jgi:hypothetical protein